MDRRRFHRLLGASLLAAGTAPWMAGPLAAAQGAGGPPAWLAALADASGRFRFAGLRADGGAAFDLALPDRGHSVALAPHGSLCVLFARRPGTFALVVDWRVGEPMRWIDSPPGRHFYGHGVFSGDGRTLFATENDYERGTGVVAVFDAADGFRRVAEMPSHGIGPHDLRLLSDGRTLVIANGGIQTHPDAGREKLNIPTMQPSLAYVDSADGRLTGDYRLPPDRHLLGIRHLAVTPDDTVVVAMQAEGPESDIRPLVAVHRGGDALRLLAAPRVEARRMRNYAGSAAVDSSGAVAAVSAPRGNLVTFWDVAGNRWLGAADVADGCGVSATGRAGEFALSSGLSGLYLYDVATGVKRHLSSSFADAVHWDNHLIPAGG